MVTLDIAKYRRSRTAAVGHIIQEKPLSEKNVETLWYFGIFSFSSRITMWLILPQGNPGSAVHCASFGKRTPPETTFHSTPSNAYLQCSEKFVRKFE